MEGLGARFDKNTPERLAPGSCRRVLNMHPLRRTPHRRRYRPSE